MDPRITRIHVPLYYALHNTMDPADDVGASSIPGPARTYIQDARTLLPTPTDFIEYPNSHVFLIDVPGLLPGDVRVIVDYGSVLIVYGDRKRGVQPEEGADYLIMERRVGKFIRKFSLPANGDTDSISAVYREGVLTVTLPKLTPPPETPNTFKINVA